MDDPTKITDVIPHDTVAAHTFASWLLNLIDDFLDLIGLGRFKNLEEVIYMIVVVAVAFFIGWLFQKFVQWALGKVVSLRHGTIGKELLQMHTLTKCCLIIPPLFVMALAPFAFENNHTWLEWIERLTGVYALIALGVGLSSVMNFIFFHYNLHDNTKGLPIKGVLNIGKGILWIILVIIAVSVIVDKSPAVLLTGLGAFAAALMLIFKDSILGFVAGIQMSQNDMLHEGDWIVVPNTPANGTVIDVTLSAVKIQNFDNTIVTVPPYTLISTSFQNYRGMWDYGARRMVKTLTMDVTTIFRLTDAQTDSIVAKYPILKEFVDRMRASGQLVHSDDSLRPINGTLETNLGLFRAYCCLYLSQNPMISSTSQILVRLLDASAYGLPLEIYCFTATTNWNEYEGIQSAVLEHITSVVSDFGLNIYSSSTLTVSTADSQAVGSPAPAGPTPELTIKATTGGVTASPKGTPVGPGLAAPPTEPAPPTGPAPADQSPKA